MGEQKTFLPDIEKCRLCIFFRVYPRLACFKGSAGERTILDSSIWLPDRKIPTSDYPDCQKEGCL